MTLTLFASGGAILLQSIDPADPARAAVLVEVLILGAWGTYALWQSLRRCPVTFSRPDAALLCQTPVQRRAVTLRWLLMPWFKSGVLFWLAAVTLGFSYAETVLPEFTGADRILEYSGYGFAAWAAIIPVHLALVSLTWAFGVYRLHSDRQRRWLVWPVLVLTIGFAAFLLFPGFGTAGPFWPTVYTVFSYPLQGGFGIGSLSASLAAGGILAVAILSVLAWVSDNFSLSRAAQETQDAEMVQSLRRYGFASSAAKAQAEQRLGISRAPSRLPAMTGAGALVWKDVLQSQRAFRWTALFGWLSIFGLMFGLALLPDVSSQAFAVGFWVITVGRLCSTRIRNDLSYWTLIRQLPISHRKFMLAELSGAFLLVVAVSLLGLASGSMLVRNPVYGLGVLIPGMAAGIVGVAAFDIIRRSDSTLLLNGSVPEVGVGGIILGLLFAFAPLATILVVPGVLGIVLSAGISIGLSWVAFNLAVRAYQKVDVVL